MDVDIPIDLSDYDFNQTEMEEMLRLIYNDHSEVQDQN